MLRFPDNTMVSVKGLDDIMKELLAENRNANADTEKEIIEKLEERGNFIPSSERARREYAYVLLGEYRKYVKEHAEKKE